MKQPSTRVGMASPPCSLHHPQCDPGGQSAAPPVAYAFSDHRLAVGPRELSRAGRVLELSSRVFDCLVYLIEHRDRAIGRDELVAAIWGRVDVSDAQLGQVILRARRAVGDDGHEQRLIRTMPKFGYRWIAPVQPEHESRDASTAGVERRTPSATAHAAPPRRARPAFALLAAGFVVATAFGFARPREDVVASAIAGEPLAVVLPVEVVPTPDGEWIRLGGMDALGARLRAGGLRVASSDDVLAMLVEAGRGGTQASSRLGGATLIVRAGLLENARGWHADISATLADGTVLKANGTGEAPLPALRLAGDRLLAQVLPADSPGIVVARPDASGGGG